MRPRIIFCTTISRSQEFRGHWIDSRAIKCKSRYKFNPINEIAPAQSLPTCTWKAVISLTSLLRYPRTY